MDKPKRRRGRPKGSKPEKITVNTCPHTFTGVCRVCSGEVKVVMELPEGANMGLKSDIYRKSSGTCSKCGTYFSGPEVIEIWQVTGEVVGSPMCGKLTSCKDYRKSRMTETYYNKYDRPN